MYVREICAEALAFLEVLAGIEEVCIQTEYLKLSPGRRGRLSQLMARNKGDLVCIV